jgi:curved DNA-binding protein CbpA
VVDYFALLNFPRNPWLDPAAVQARFLELSAAAHPDRVHGLGSDQIAEANRKFSDLNKAAAVLRDPKERLQHLIALETNAAPSATQNIPPELIDLFAKVGHTCRSVDQFISERANTTSPMLQAQLFAKGLDWTDRITELQSAVAALKDTALKRLQQTGEQWPNQKDFQKLAELAHMFAMIGRWESQLQERFAGLAA